MDEDLPIDIQCNKLVDWLIDRRHCSIRWQKAAEIVKDKIASALLDMPGTEEMKKLLEGSCFHYFKCLKIVEVLKDTEKDSKNIFGMYSSKRMKDWREIVKLYEKDNLNLAELSNRLLRNVNYEIPAVKKQIAKCAQIQEECRKKIQDSDRNIHNVERTYAEECKKFGIDGKHVRKELLDLVAGLSKDFDAIARKCKELLPVIEYYSTFVEFSLSNDKFSAEICPLLRHVCEHGNTTVYHWIHGAMPDKVLKEDLSNNKAMTENDSEEIDWGATDDVDGAGDNVIDFNIDLSDLGIEVENAGDAGNGTNDNEFEIIVEKDSEKWEVEEVSIAEVPNGTKLVQEEKIAEGDEALTVLEFVKTRVQFINELLELLGFLSQRLVEDRREADFLSTSQFMTAPPILQLTSSSELESMKELVSSIHDDITSNKMTQLCRILDSPKYVDRIADGLIRQLALKTKYEKMKMSYDNTITNSQSEAKSLHPRVDFLIKETKEWQKLIESEISKRYKNREVCILGSINLL